jgi:hypothetical protein
VHLLVALMCCSAAALAQSTARPVVFVSPDGDDQQAGDSPETAWRSLSAVQRALDRGLFHAGGEIRLARGATFAAGLNIRRLALSAEASLVLTAYGEGPLPSIRGSATLTGWESLGGKLWRAPCPQCAALPGVVFRDGSVLPIARWPNPEENDQGYLYYQSAEGRTAITDERLAGAIDWTGGEAVLRSAAWILDRLPILRHQGSTLSFGSPATYAIAQGYGYFLQNHPAALDRDGEWIFDPATRSVTVYLENTTPDDHELSVTIADTLLSVSDSQGIEIRDLRLARARRANLEIQQSARIRIQNVESVQAGDTGMRCLDCRDLRIEDSLIDQALNHGLDVFNCTDCRVERNRITQTATIAGMGRSGNSQYNGVRFGGANAAFVRNAVSRTGYLGIDIRGAARVEQNVFTEPNLVKTDGGGIYTWGNRGVEIVGNLVMNGAGSKAGVPWNNPATHGIYIDDQCEDILVQGNTVVSFASHGIYLHNTRAVTVERNTVLDASEAQIAYIDDLLGSHTVSESVIRYNVFLSRRDGALMARASTNAGPEFFRAIGTMTGNRYCAPFADAVFLAGAEGKSSRLFLDSWPALVGTDDGALRCPWQFAPYHVEAVSGPNRVQNGTFDRDISPWFGWPGGSFEAAWDEGRLRLRHTADAPILHYDAPVGLVEKGRYYRARFQAQSEGPGRMLRVYLRKWDPDYRLLGSAVDIPLDGQARSWEFIVHATETEPRSLLIFELPNASRIVWLDNVQLEPVDAIEVDRSERVRVELNAALEPRTILLDQDRFDITGTRLPAGTLLTVDPLGAAILFSRP